MRNYNPEVYRPKVRVALAYYYAAVEVEREHNRNFNFWIPAYYLLSHALELLLKATWEYEHKDSWIKNAHNLMMIYAEISQLNIDERLQNTMSHFDLFNDGPGGLRYDNDPKFEFYPGTFDDGIELFKLLLTYIQREYVE